MLSTVFQHIRYITEAASQEQSVHTARVHFNPLEKESVAGCIDGNALDSMAAFSCCAKLGEEGAFFKAPCNVKKPDKNSRMLLSQLSCFKTPGEHREKNILWRNNFNVLFWRAMKISPPYFQKWHALCLKEDKERRSIPLH